jgi:hypothetical protein
MGGVQLSIYTKLFWKDTFERVLATLAQVLLAVLGVDGLDLLQVDTTALLSTLAIAAALVVLKAVIAAVATNNSSTVSPASFAPTKGIEAR